MRYYLDTNILEFLMHSPKQNLHHDIASVLFDYSNILLTSTVCVQEFIHLAQIGKLNRGRGRKCTVTAGDLLDWLETTGIEIVPVSRLHLRQYAALPLHGDHRDPNDRLIIAQAISDRISLISSDGKFSEYSSDGLDFVYNER